MGLFRRSRPGREPSPPTPGPGGDHAARPDAPGPAAWEHLPPLTPTLTPPPSTFKIGAAVKDDLVALASPRLSGSLGHLVSDAGPAGVVSGLATVGVQRRADGSSPPPAPTGPGDGRGGLDLSLAPPPVVAPPVVPGGSRAIDAPRPVEAPPVEAAPRALPLVTPTVQRHADGGTPADGGPTAVPAPPAAVAGDPAPGAEPAAADGATGDDGPVPPADSLGDLDDLTGADADPRDIGTRPLSSLNPPPGRPGTLGPPVEGPLGADSPGPLAHVQRRATGDGPTPVPPAPGGPGPHTEMPIVQRVRGTGRPGAGSSPGPHPPGGGATLPSSPPPAEPSTGSRPAGEADALTVSRIPEAGSPGGSPGPAVPLTGDRSPLTTGTTSGPGDEAPGLTVSHPAAGDAGDVMGDGGGGDDTGLPGGGGDLPLVQRTPAGPAGDHDAWASHDPAAAAAAVDGAGAVPEPAPAPATGPAGGLDATTTPGRGAPAGEAVVPTLGLGEALAGPATPDGGGARAGGPVTPVDHGALPLPVVQRLAGRAVGAPVGDAAPGALSPSVTAVPGHPASTARGQRPPATLPLAVQRSLGAPASLGAALATGAGAGRATGSAGPAASPVLPRPTWHLPGGPRPEVAVQRWGGLDDLRSAGSGALGSAAGAARDRVAEAAAPATGALGDLPSLDLPAAPGVGDLPLALPGGVQAPTASSLASLPEAGGVRDLPAVPSPPATGIGGSTPAATAGAAAVPLTEITFPPPAAPAEPAAAAPGAAAAAGGDGPGGAPDSAQLDELAHKLYDRIRWRLRSELRMDRERAGLGAGVRR